MSSSVCRDSISRGFKAAIAVAGLVVAQSASADVLTYDGPWFSWYGAYRIHDSVPGPIVDVNARAGAFKMTDTSVNPQNTFMAWCVDIYDNMNTSPPWTTYTLMSGADFYAPSPYMATDLSRLASWVFDNHLLTDGAASAAFQLAAWEIVNESGGHGAYDVNGGDFYATSSASNVLSTANDWLDVVSAGQYRIDQRLSVWQQDVDGSTQNLAVFAPVPEPETILMLVSGLGLMVFVARGRRHARNGA